MNDPTFTKFAFQYHLDLGEQNVAKIVIDQDSDPYVEASKFCAKHQLKSIYVTIIGDAIATQMKLQKQTKSIDAADQGRQMTIQGVCNKKCEILESTTMQTELKQQAQNAIQRSFQRTGSSAQLKRKQVNRNSNVFENLYHNHKQIEMKKEIIRKRSFQAIPFKPKINRLSERIVEKKRSLGNAQLNLPSSTLVNKQISLEKEALITLNYTVSKPSNRQNQSELKQNRANEQKNKNTIKQEIISYKRRQLPQEIISKLTENKSYDRNHGCR